MPAARRERHAVPAARAIPQGIAIPPEIRISDMPSHDKPITQQKKAASTACAFVVGYGSSVKLPLNTGWQGSADNSRQLGGVADSNTRNNIFNYIFYTPGLKHLENLTIRTCRPDP